MSPELMYLFLASILLMMLWMPNIVGQVIHGGMIRPQEYVSLRDISVLPDWVRRANRAHINLVEQFGAFAGLVVVGHLAQVSTGLTVAAAAVFFWARVVHAVVMISGFKYLMARSLVFTVAWAALLIFAWQIAAARLF